jgi:hypothetical protein
MGTGEGAMNKKMPIIYDNTLLLCPFFGYPSLKVSNPLSSVELVTSPEHLFP